MLVEYFAILFATYFITACIVCTITNDNLRLVLTSPYQVYPTLLVYWWIPLVRLSDMADANKKAKRVIPLLLLIILVASCTPPKNSAGCTRGNKNYGHQY